MDTSPAAYSREHGTLDAYVKKIPSIMNYAQRKRHRIIWLVLAILLPVLFVLAMMSVPEMAVQEEQFLNTHQ